MRKLKNLFVLTLMVLAAACSPKKKNEEAKSEAFEKAEKEVQEKISAVVRELPPPSEVPFLLMETGAEFNISLIHDISKISDYATDNTLAALNLGVYAADVAYLSSYQKSQDALTYLEKVRPLADQLSLSGAFDPATIKRFEESLSNADSMKVIVNEAMATAKKQLNEADRSKTAALLLAGSFIEGLYVATALIENYPEDVLPEDTRSLILIPLVDVVINQEKPVNDLIVILKEIDGEDEVVTNLISGLEGLSKEYEQLDVKGLMDEGRGDLLLQDTALDNITNQMGSIRDSITH